jgi:hypothetical protein
MALYYGGNGSDYVRRPSFSSLSSTRIAINLHKPNRRRHVMLTSHPKTPGQVQDPSGVGNDDFDNGLKKSEFGYPVLGLYKLREPLKAGKMREYGVSPPQGLVYAPKILVEGVPVGEMERLF